MTFVADRQRIGKFGAGFINTLKKRLSLPFQKTIALRVTTTATKSLCPCRQVERQEAAPADFSPAGSDKPSPTGRYGPDYPRLGFPCGVFCWLTSSRLWLFSLVFWRPSFVDLWAACCSDGVAGLLVSGLLLRSLGMTASVKSCLATLTSVSHRNRRAARVV